MRGVGLLLGEHDYHLLVNNCEHFVLWCIEGRHDSPQVNHASTAFAVTGTTLLKSSHRQLAAWWHRPVWPAHLWPAAPSCQWPPLAHQHGHRWPWGPPQPMAHTDCSSGSPKT